MVSSKIPPLPQVVDEYAVATPDAVWGIIPNSEDLKDGFRNITFKRLSETSNQMARWLERRFGTSDTKDPIAYIGTNDTRYIVTMLAVQKTGHSILLPSPRNTAEAQQHVLKATSCTKLVYSSKLKLHVQEVEGGDIELVTHQMPELSEVLSQTTDKEPYDLGKLSDNPFDTAIVLHTSGSTGMPKPIYIKNGYMAAMRRAALETPRDRPTMMLKLFKKEALFASIPWFHAMGLFMILRSIYGQTPLILPPNTIVPNPVTTIELIKASKPDHGIFPPSVLEDIVEIEGGLEVLATMKDIYYGGAPLASDVGDRIASLPNTKIQTMIGSTEAGLLDSYITDKEDYNFFEFPPWVGTKMEPQDDGLSEHLLKREPEYASQQGVFYTFPDIAEWHTKDLYEPHPTKPNLWRCVGRKDDVIVLSNGEKFGPVDLEKTVEGHPAVHGALVVGEGHFQAGLLIEPDWEHAKGVNDSEELIDLIWPSIEKGNNTVAAHGRVFKSKVAVAKQGKAFIRAPKGSIMRRQTNIHFKDEIEALYSGESIGVDLPELTSDSTMEEIKKTLHRITDAMSNVSGGIRDDDDIFRLGIDSLGVLGITSTLNHILPKDKNSTKPGLVYSNPSINSLASAIHAILHDSDTNSTASSVEQMQAMIAKYTTNLPARITLSPQPGQHTVLLTGSTGSLGTYLLHALLQSPKIAQIYCLNRSSSSSTRQTDAFKSRSLAPNFEKATFLHTTLDAPNFGLDDKTYSSLRSSATLIIHNAWAVDFNLSLQSFEKPHIASVRAFVDFSASAAYHPEIMFVSSIGSVGNWAGSGQTGPITESPAPSDEIVGPQGYGQSKHVAGRILEAAARDTGLRATVVRVGQLAGPVEYGGVWGKQEWLPSLVASAGEMGVVPRSLGGMDVDWVPVDVAARVLLELSLAPKDRGEEAGYFSLVNPRVASWGGLVGVVQEWFRGRGREVGDVELKEWVGKLKGMEASQEVARRVPALKLVDFYEGILESGKPPGFETERTAAMSESLRRLEAVGEGWMRTWMEQWNF
ncbi:MAG: hypothetical protein MMC23_000271 [Stictis urceolatum]|nr:hypothetical protein [Stictis urceolata]